MKCLVTGGAGFIGSNLVDLLLECGHEVVVLDNLSTGRRDNLSLRCRFFEGDLAYRGDIDRAIVGCQVVFHLAASVGNIRSIAYPLNDAMTNVLGTINVLEASRAAKVHRIVYSSSAGIFGELVQLPIAEDHPCEPDSPYGCTKLCAEKLCLDYAKIHNLSTICLRYFNVYGPRQRYDAYGNVIPIFAEKLVQKQPLTIYGDGNQTRDFVSVHDVVRANLLAATVLEASGVYNIGSGTGISINSLVKMMGADDLVYADARPGDVMHSVADISKAQKELGYVPSVPLANGIQAYLEWFRREGV